jgi:alpha-galactosidase
MLNNIARPVGNLKGFKRPDLLASLVAAFESAGSDYSAWFGYGHTGGDVAARRLEEPTYEQEVARQIAGTEPIELRRSDEYGTLIIHAEQTGALLRINGNVPNDDLITNLPDGVCVEVPCLVAGEEFTLAWWGPSPHSWLP